MRRLGIDYVQGFHVGRPMPLEHWDALRVPL
jgi:EAL domain-containing protein (putative c-di-GMP-specific phosphodiesterase class I)